MFARRTDSIHASVAHWPKRASRLSRTVRTTTTTAALCGVPGERVAVCGHSSADFALSVFAITEAGGVAVLLSHHDPPARTAAHVAFSGARFLLHDAQSAA